MTLPLEAASSWSPAPAGGSRSAPGSPAAWSPTAPLVLHSWSPHDAEQPWGADEGGVEALVEECARPAGPSSTCEDLGRPGGAARARRRRARVRAVDAVVANHGAAPRRTWSS